MDCTELKIDRKLVKFVKNQLKIGVNRSTLVQILPEWWCRGGSLPDSAQPSVGSVTVHAKIPTHQPFQRFGVYLKNTHQIRGNDKKNHDNWGGGVT
jgi:hypothetical protein